MAATIEPTISTGLTIPFKPFGALGNWKRLVCFGLHNMEVRSIRCYILNYWKHDQDESENAQGYPI
jgi:hypothetical protein